MEHSSIDYQVETKEQSITDTFIEVMDSLFYEGYARQLAEDNPALFQFELNNFLDNYSF